MGDRYGKDSYARNSRRSFATQARPPAAGIPQIAVVHGAPTAGGAYLPGLSDYVILVRGRSRWAREIRSTRKGISPS